ncbi:hypothetical protein [Streptomyces lunaelactis]|uniref:hypothetical protein n=1 Tax=Streptomyces lunaelactis TaxID=1535768 RepID=UPI0015849D26|nr:hypothetical protein [Streptomyces lunaelactis]NUK62035.1 hypothetical protein [Streptomyces lunaelactis]
MTDLTPTPQQPGLHVAKPAKDFPAHGSYACRCGATDRARGDDNVRDLVAVWIDHRNTCPHR